jgi:hypothetical protein
VSTISAGSPRPSQLVCMEALPISLPWSEGSLGNHWGSQGGGRQNSILLGLGPGPNSMNNVWNFYNPYKAGQCSQIRGVTLYGWQTCSSAPIGYIYVLSFRNGWPIAFFATCSWHRANTSPIAGRQCVGPVAGGHWRSRSNRVLYSGPHVWLHRIQWWCQWSTRCSWRRRARLHIAVCLSSALEGGLKMAWMILEAVELVHQLIGDWAALKVDDTPSTAPELLCLWVICSENKNLHIHVWSVLTLDQACDHVVAHIRVCKFYSKSPASNAHNIVSSRMWICCIVPNPMYRFVWMMSDRMWICGSVYFIFSNTSFTQLYKTLWNFHVFVYTHINILWHTELTSHMHWH